ncbi:hypothetical protein D3C85_1451880 [compost metagenome]
MLQIKANLMGKIQLQCVYNNPIGHSRKFVVVIAVFSYLISSKSIMMVGQTRIDIE